ncbi:MAG: hypothetical protein ABUK01_12060 [Leptospirales bacterium]
MKNNVYNIIHYEYVKPNLKKPLIYSVLLHLVLGIYLGLNSTPSPAGSVSLSMIIGDGNGDEAIEEGELPENNENMEATENVTSDSIEEDIDIPGIGFNNSEYKANNARNETDYDPGSNGKNTNRDYNVSNTNRDTENIDEWAEHETQKINSDKSTTSDKVREPGKARIKAQKIKWFKGTPRVITYEPKIEFPEIFRSRGMQYEVVIKISVNSEGHVVSAEIEKGCGETRLDILARNGLMDTRFKKKESSSGNDDLDIAYIIVAFAFPK